MPASTPIYGFPYPLGTDPVGQGAQDIEDLATAVETQFTVVESQLVLAVPVASVMPYAGTTAPASWLLCFGQNISRTVFASLFSVIGTTYGVGDGSTTFTLPDLRGRSVAGKDNMGGTTASRVTATSGINGVNLGAAGGAETMVHTHSATSAGGDLRTAVGASGGDAGSISYQAAGTLAPGPANVTAYTLFGLPFTTALRGFNHYTPVYGTTSQGSNQVNMQPTIILNYIIKA